MLSPGQIARQRATEIVNRHVEEMLQSPGSALARYIRWGETSKGTEWHLLPNAEEQVGCHVYPDAFFLHPEATRTSPRQNPGVASVLAASGLAGARKDYRDRERLRRELHGEPPYRSIRDSGWSQILPGLRKIEWIKLIEAEGISWRRAATILRELDFPEGRLSLPVNDHAQAPPELAGRPDLWPEIFVHDV